MKLAESNILLMAMVKVFPGYSTVNFQSLKCSLVDIHFSRSGDKSKIINSSQLKILAEMVGGMG